ncbi:MAG: phosphoribosylglycinamide formyltransferase [Desulfobulbaceae bacterium]|jgi:phosphoribosylglycinamide formyltransferase-1|nr:phosphoribosylglycinamide formyltransferase [Desulfobulbaceae bacterium]
MLNLAVLLSGTGRTLDNFHEYIEQKGLTAHIRLVVADVENALGLTKARRYGYPAFFARNNADINAILANYPIDLICLAGYLPLYQPPAILAKRVINIHPSLIPAFCGPGFYGHHVHEAVRARGCLVSGCTVHFADDRYDHGPIICQKAVSLADHDDADAIAAKVFTAECLAYPEAINRVAALGVDYFWERCRQ